MNDVHYFFVAALDWHALSTHWILTLAHFLWQGAAIGLLTALALSISRHSSPRIRHRICLASLVSCIPCLVATWMWIDVDGFSASKNASEAVAIATADERNQPTPASRPSPPLTPAAVSPDPDTSGTPYNDSIPEAAQNERASADRPPAPPTATSMLYRAAPVIAVGYFLGVILLLFRTSLGLWGGRRLRRLSRPVVDSELLRLIEQQARKIGLKTAPVVAYCSRVAVPTVIGILKPIVLLPASLVTNLDSDQLAAILSHEFAHIRRHDLFVNLLQRVIEALLFFHPAVWWLSRRITIERENCCDDLASASGFGNLRYAGALLRMAELSLPQRNKKFASQLVALSAEGQNAPDLSRRIERLLNIPRPPRLAVSRVSAVFAVVLSVISVGVLAQIADRDPVEQNPVVENISVNDSEDEGANSPETLRETTPSAEAKSNEEVAQQVPDVPEKGLEFLKPYPKLYSLSLTMTEPQFLKIAQREKLKFQKYPDGETYGISTGDGHTVLVMFGNDGNTCSGIQRIRGDSLAEKSKTELVADEDGIYWSSQVRDGFRVGAKLLVKEGQLTSGERLVVQYVLMNESEEAKTIPLVPSKPVFPSLGAVNRIELSLFPANGESETFTLKPGEILEESAHRVSIDTTGFPPGQYRVLAKNFFWRPDPDDPSRKHGFPIRLELPLTILLPEGTKPTGAATANRPQDIDWGRNVTGLQVGSRVLGDTNLFASGSAPQVQLFLSNITERPIEVEVFLPHPADGWLLNVESREGENVLLERTNISTYFPQESFKLSLAPGETVPFTGVEQSVNEAARKISNSSFRIEREKPEMDFWKGGILVSQGGVYGAIHTVFLKRPDMPGVRLNVDSGKSIFRVSGPESKPETSAKGGETDPGDDGEASIRNWKARLVDGMTGKPLPGIKVRAKGSVAGKTEPQPMNFVSDEQGIVTVPLRDGTVTSLDIRTLGWWLGGGQFGDHFLGQPPSNPDQSDQQDQPPVFDPETPRDFKLWLGDIVNGRLLYPDKSPAAGVMLNVGVYITNVEWKKRLGMDLTWYSFDHGDWPNWSRRIITNDDGTFTTTVPPEEARWWVRVGTTALGFGSIGPEIADPEGLGRALATCVPFEAEIGGRTDAGFGYEAVEDGQAGSDDGTLNFGTLKLIAGIRVRGRVVDSAGNGLEGVYLLTKGAHGPFSGRSTWSGEGGRFEFLPVEAGSLTIHPDARLRDVERKVISRDVRAVFIDQQYIVPSEAVELIVKAVPHVELEFEWVDRRADKTDRVSYYGDFKVVGHYPIREGQTAYWHGETILVEREGRKLLVVKVPRKLVKPTLILTRDRVVTASYEDETGKTSGPGRVELGDITRPIRRTIYGDEPTQRE